MGFLRQTCAWVFVLLAGAFLAEAAYRTNLLIKDPRIQLREQSINELPPIGAYSRSLWRFDADEGFQYLPRDGLYHASITGGRIAGCSPVSQLSRHGTAGRGEGDPNQAEITVALFGDSFSVFVDDGNSTWVDRLQKNLQLRTGRSVFVHNLARDGSGLVQMFDVAASQISKGLKPDLIIIAFNTNQMLSQRTWRVEMTVDGEPRIITTLRRTEAPDLRDLNSSYDTALLHNGVSERWCSTHSSGGPLDAVGFEIIDRYLRYRPHRYSAFIYNRSFLWHRILNGDAFYEGFRPDRSRVSSSVVSEGVIAADEQLKRSIAILKASRIPLMLTHLPLSVDVKAGRRYSIAGTEAVGQAVAQVSATDITEVVDFMPPLEIPERMNASPSDMHPSPWGMDLYAEAVAAAVVGRMRW